MGQSKTVLIADDEPNVRLVLKTALEYEGFSVQEAADGLEVLEKVRPQLPDAILLDVMMPNLDGIGALRRLRADPQTARIPVVIITVLYDISRLLNPNEDLSVAAYLEKPFSASLLVEKLRGILGDPLG